MDIDASLLQAAVHELKRQGLMLATAESCTGGWVAQAVTSVAGSSEWFERGFIVYTNLSKREMLGVSAQLLSQHGAVSEPVARAMAEGARVVSRNKGVCGEPMLASFSGSDLGL
jgi:nicotinamide-nucleotide amidase